MKLSREALLLCALAVFALAVSRASAQQVRCFRSLPCGGTDFFLADSVEACCLADDGLIVEPTPGSERCVMCRVFGWISGDPDPSNRLRRRVNFTETGDREPLVIGFSKGIPTGEYDVQLRGTVTEGLATQGATADFRLEGDIEQILISSAQSGPTTTVPAIIQNDNVALEPDEDFTLSFEVTESFPDNLLTGTGGVVVLVTELQVFIEDQTELLVQFTESDYSQDENRGSLPVAVRVSADIGSELVLSIVKKNLSEVYNNTSDGGVQEPALIDLPDGFSDLGVFDPAQPYIASSVDGAVAKVDYDTSTQTVTFPAGSPDGTTAQSPVRVIDDIIDEADEEFFVLLLATDDERVDLTGGRFASRGIIRDNERTTIGFELDTYRFPENRIPPLVRDEVFIIKENNQLSELTFTIRILTATGTGIGFATNAATDPISESDFNGGVEAIIEFEPGDQELAVNFLLINDIRFEGDETFDFEIANAGSVPFDTSRATTTIIIEDDEDVIIGFELPLEFTVDEDVGMQQLCLVIITPGPEVNLTFSYRIGAVTVEGTADSADYGAIVGGGSPRLLFNNENRRHCFNVNITDDLLFEDSEFFTVEARENPPFFGDLDGVSLHPNRSVVTITIIDLDTLVIGYDRTLITVREDGGSVDVNAVVIDGTLGTTVEIRSATADGTATSGNDYEATVATAIFSPTVDSLLITVPIINDNVSEVTENFGACLTFTDEADLILRGLRDRITLNPDKAEIIIDDDDPFGARIGFVRTVETVDENVGLVTIGVRWFDPNPDLPPDTSISVRLFTVDGTATAGDDYDAINITLTFTLSNTLQEVQLRVINDSLLEPTEDLIAVLELISAPTSVDVLLDPAIETIIIEDNERIVIGLERTTYTVDEDGGEVIVCSIVRTTGVSLGRDVEVTFCTGDGSAVADQDYNATTVVLTFNAANRRHCVSIPIIDDDLVEGNEEFLVSLKTTDPAVTLDPQNGTVTIIDDIQPVELLFELPSYTFLESAGVVAITVDKRGTHTNPILVRVFGGPSTQTDIVQSAPAIDTVLTFNSGDTRLPAFLNLTDDFIALEAVERYLMTLSLEVLTPGVTIVPPGTATLNVLDDDVVTVRFVERMYRVQEDMGPVQVCLTRDIPSLADVIVTITTIAGTASSPADYSPLVSQPVNLGTAADSVACVNIAIVPDNITEPDEIFTVVIDPPVDRRIVVGVPDTASVLIEDPPTSGLVLVNDTIDADPVLTVPLHVTNLEDIGMEGIQLSMCFELRGRPDSFFNLVSDECLSASAYYSEVDDTGIHIITEVAIRAADNAGVCHNIRVMRDPCSATVDGVPVVSAFNSDGISVKVYSNRVRVSVPNCDERTVVLYLYCRSNTFWADEDTPVDADFLYMRVMRGLNFGHRNSHGIIGQFWNVDSTIAPYTGPLRVTDTRQHYSVTLQRPQSGNMATFTGLIGRFQWGGLREPCLFVGNAQAGPVYEVEENNDGVIEGTYSDYIVSEPYSEDGYRFGRFDEDECV